MKLYMLECEDGSFYTGIAKDVDKRFLKHLCGKGAKYTRSHKPVRIVLTCECQDKSQALRLESKIKKLSHVQKQMLIWEFENTFFYDQGCLLSLLEDL